MKTLSISLALALTFSVASAATPEACKLRGAIYGAIAQDRDRGISESESKKKIQDFFKSTVPGAEKSTGAYEIIGQIYRGRLKNESPEMIRGFFEWECLKNG